MSSSATTTSRSSSLREPASTSSIGRPPETKRPISSRGRWVAERPMRWNGWFATRTSRSREIARWAPRLVPATAWTSSTMTVSIPRSISRALRGEQQDRATPGRDQDVRWLAQHLAAFALLRVPGADPDRKRRAEACERSAQVALDVVVQRLQRGHVEQPEPFAGAGVEPVDAGEECSQRLARAGRGLHENVRSARDDGPRSCLRRRRPGERTLEPGARRGRKGGECVHSSRVARPTRRADACRCR